LLGFSDQFSLGQQIALNNGEPNIRFVATPRVGTGDQRVSQFISACLKALTDPLTAKEKESGLYTPPPDPRIAFTGTLLDSQSYFIQPTSVANCGNCPIAQWTDGLPIVIPTEDAVKEMLTGTKHSAVEQITFTTNTSGNQGRPVTWYPMGWGSTVEKIATIAVMSGCRPEYLPVVLTIAASGASCPSSNMLWNGWGCVSGPIAKEIGMNAGQGGLNPGNVANMSIGRSWELIIINIGGAIQGVNRLETFGSPWNKGTFFAENVDGIPSGWQGLNVESGYKSTDSMLTMQFSLAQVQGGVFAPSSFRGLNSGTGGIANRLGVLGKPGTYNFLEYMVPGLWTLQFGPRMLILHPNMAQSLKDYGFQSKTAVMQWLWDASKAPAGDFRKYGWYDFFTNAGSRIEQTTGKAYKDIPDDTLIPYFGDKPDGKGLIVGPGPGDEICIALEVGGGIGWSMPTYPIDTWR
jgi:hypothetical protein